MPVTSSSATAVHRSHFKIFSSLRAMLDLLQLVLFSFFVACLSDYHQVPGHRGLVESAAVGKYPCPARCERDRSILALSQHHGVNAEMCTENRSLPAVYARVVIDNGVKPVW